AGGVVLRDGRRARGQARHTTVVDVRAAHQLGPEDVEAALEQAAKVGDVGLLALRLLAAGAQLDKVDPLDVGKEARVEHPVDAAMPARNNLCGHASPLGT